MCTFLGSFTDRPLLVYAAAFCCSIYDGGFTLDVRLITKCVGPTLLMPVTTGVCEHIAGREQRRFNNQISISLLPQSYMRSHVGWKRTYENVCVCTHYAPGIGRRTQSQHSGMYVATTTTNYQPRQVHLKSPLNLKHGVCANRRDRQTSRQCT